MNKSVIAILSLMLIACSNQAAKVSYDKNRVGKGVIVSSGMPNFYLEESYKPQVVKQESAKATRSPASVSSTDKNIEKLSPNKVYFLSLYVQYKKFENLLGTKSQDLRICPAFHNDLIVHNKWIEAQTATMRSSAISASKNYLSAIEDKSKLPYFPELSLPVSENASENVYQYVKDFKHNQTISEFVKVALEEHARKNKQELIELCEYGKTGNYYRYLNLKSHVDTHPEFSASIGGLRAMLKVPVFANLLLLNSVDQNAVASLYEGANRDLASQFSVFEKVMIKRFNANWIGEYFRRINKLSSNSQFAFKN